jgi:hypothetical protein
MGIFLLFHAPCIAAIAAFRYVGALIRGITALSMAKGTVSFVGVEYRSI